jgi:hypothetical protein
MVSVHRTSASLHFLRTAANRSCGKPLSRPAWAVLFLLACAAGCNPIQTGAKLGVRLAGEVIEDGDVKKRAEALVGRPVSAADEMFGKTIEVWKDVRSDRRWRTYPVKLDVLGHQRYVVEVLADKIVAVSKAEKSSRKVDIPRALILEAKVKGKSPQECQARLDFGSPLLAARSETTHRLVQIYDAGTVTDLGTPHYCILRFDTNDRCDDLGLHALSM